MTAVIVPWIARALVLVAAGFMLSARTFDSFEPVRIKVVRTTRSAGDHLTLQLPPDLDTGTLPRPLAVIWRVRNDSPHEATFTLGLNGVPVCQHAVEAGRSRRIDCAAGAPLHAATPESVAVSGPSAWSFEYLELASHHGSSSGLFILPATSSAYAAPSAIRMLALLVIVGLLLAVPAPAIHQRWLRRLHIAATSLVAVFAITLAAAPWISPFQAVISQGVWLGAMAVVLLPRLVALGFHAVARALAQDPIGRTGKSAVALAAYATRHRRSIGRAAVAVLAISSAAVSLFFGVKTASGSDCFGYVSQAYLWLEGTLAVPYPAINLGPVEYPEWFLGTLAYVPGTTPGTLVPTYPPGLPLLMAGVLAMVGTWGPFLVVPASAGLLIVATYILGRRFESAPVGLAAAVLVAFSPAVIFQSLWPMSDVPAAAVWTFCLAAALGRGRSAPLAAGVLAGLAILIRPNLAPLAVFGALLLSRSHPIGSRGWIKALGLYALTAAPFIVFLGWFNAHLYGSPLRSGYGDLRVIYSWGFIWPNLVNYSSWFVASQGWLLAALAVYGWGRAVIDRALRPLAFFAAAVFAAYLPYLVFDDWFWLRFLLPAYPALLVITASAGVALLRRLRRRVRPAVAVAGLALVLGHSVWFIQSKNPFGLHRGEHRYAAIGGYVRAALPENAAFFTMQHSGSLRYYSGRLTVRYDWLQAGHLARARAALEDAGYDVYVLVDDWEEPDLRKRFTAPGETAFLDSPPLIEVLGLMRVRVYRLSDDGEPTPPETTYIESGRGVPVPPVRPQAVAWEPPNR